MHIVSIFSLECIHKYIFSVIYIGISDIFFIKLMIKKNKKNISNDYNLLNN